MFQREPTRILERYLVSEQRSPSASSRLRSGGLGRGMGSWVEDVRETSDERRGLLLRHPTLKHLLGGAALSPCLVAGARKPDDRPGRSGRARGSEPENPAGGQQ